MKKKRGQDDNSLDGSEESSESGNRSNFSFSVKPCSHFTKAVDGNNVQKVISRRKNEPPTYCEDCKKNNEEDSNVIEDESLESPPLWICLKCMHVACGRSQRSHGEKHHKVDRSEPHCIVIDTIQWSTWCYACDEFIIDEMLTPLNVKTLERIKSQLKKWTSPPTTNSLNNKPKIEVPVYQTRALLAEEKKKVTIDLPKVGGLSNLGNTCFFNSVLQCLAQTPYIVKVLDDLQVPGQIFTLPGGKYKGTDDEEVEFPPIRGVLEQTDAITSVLRKTLSDMQNSNGQVYRPTDLYCTLRKKTMNCTDGGQHDSHELLRHLLDLVRGEDVRRYQEVILEETGLNRKTKPEAVADNLKAQVKFYGNQANSKFLGAERVFRGELISTIDCLECGNISNRKEPFLDLSLPVCVDKSCTFLKRKSTGSENSTDAHGNVSNTKSKHEQKKAHKAQRKNRMNRANYKENGNLTTSNVNLISEDKKGNVGESEESDADIEDNVENEDTSAMKIKELEKSPGRPTLSADSNILNNSSFEFSSQPNEDNINCNLSPSSTDVHMKDLTENKENITEEVSTSMIIQPDVTNSEGQTLSPSSSPLTSKNSPLSPISNEDDADEENTQKTNKSDYTEKRDSSDKEDLLIKNSIHYSNKNPKKRYCTEKNGVRDLSSNLSKLNVTSGNDSPQRYPTTEGECSIQQCLNQFTAMELMNGNNKVGCTRCTEKMNKGKKGKMVCTDSTKQYLISKAPAVLILHLKRFQAQRFGFHKVIKHVNFPILLNLAPVSKDYTTPRIYALYGVVEHSGTMYGGHYIAYVKSRAPLKPNDPRWSFLPTKDGFESKDSSSSSSSSESNSELDSDEGSSVSTPPVEPPPGQWYYASDARVQEVDESTVLSSEAYLLFYERIY